MANPGRKRPSGLRTFWVILEKELRVEWRSKEVLYTGTFFALLLATIFMFGFFQPKRILLPDDPLALDLALLQQMEEVQVAPGVLWIALAFAGTTAFSRSFAREREAGCIAALRLVPGIYTPLLFGKGVANMVLLMLMQAILVPLVAVVFTMPIGEIWKELGLLLLLGTIGLSCLGTVLGAALVNMRLRELLLPLVLFPLVVPLLIAGVSATSALMLGRREAFVDWVSLMVAFDAIYLVVSAWLIKPILETSD